MRNRYIQKTPYGCGMYAVANALNLSNFVTEERLEKSKDGNRLPVLTSWLIEDGLNCGMDVLYYSHSGGKLPEEATLYKAEGDEDVEFIPLVIAVKLSEGGLNHMIGAKLGRKGELYVHDSVKEDIFKTTLEGLNDIYPEVYGVYLFSDLDTGAYLFISNKETA